MTPRLKQPLFAHYESGIAKNQMTHITMGNVIRAYDTLWSMTFRPDDISPMMRGTNSRTVLMLLGAIIEDKLGSTVFEEDPKQLSFPDEIMNPQQEAIPFPMDMHNETKLK